MDATRKLLLRQRLDDPEYMDKAVHSIEQNMAEVVSDKKLTRISETLRAKSTENELIGEEQKMEEMTSGIEQLKAIPQLINDLREENQKLPIPRRRNQIPGFSAMFSQRMGGKHAPHSKACFTILLSRSAILQPWRHHSRQLHGPWNNRSGRSPTSKKFYRHRKRP